MEIQIENCNSIDIAQIRLEPKKLNIKFAPNGTGKSTIANAIYLFSQQGSDLKSLLPFKLRQLNPDNLEPSVTISTSLNTVMRFNENYISQFVFQKDELLTDSFNVLIKNQEYLQIENEINELTQEIRSLFIQNPDFEPLVSTLKEMSGYFTLNKTGLAKNSTASKGLSSGNKIHHIPQGLEMYQPFIRSSNSVDWIDWQQRGQSFLETSDCCPFCASHTSDTKEQITKLAKEYDKKTIQNLINIINVINKLGDYFNDECRSRLEAITKLKDGLEAAHETYLRTVKSQIENFITNLEKLRNLSAFQFDDSEKVNDTLGKYILSFDFFTELKSEKMVAMITPINESIQRLQERAGPLQGKINQQKKKVQKTIERHQIDINNFLNSAGYNYEVSIVGDGEKAQLKLKHKDHQDFLEGGNQYLSFGERNAFAIVLFMYECLAKNPDLIILDDPISSFDKNKKYAILDMLFRKKAGECLRGKTVLMLTHDVEPIIDTVKSLAKKFKDQSLASFLHYKNGVINEYLIEKTKIKTFSQICKDMISSERSKIIKLIYLRRNFELIDEQGDAYQVLSNLLHGRTEPLDHRVYIDDGEQYPQMDQVAFNRGCGEIVTMFPDFSYENLCKIIQDKQEIQSLYEITDIGYEKLQLFRILFLEDQDLGNNVIQKFINETYHIENEYICQLDPNEFDTIPQYVIQECDNIIMKMSNSN